MPAPNENLDLETGSDYPEDFAASVAADIGDSLFSAPEKASSTVAEKPLVETAAEKPPAETSPAPEAPSIVPGQNSVGKPLPKSWKKDMAPHWEKLDPAVHEYVYAREADIMRGLQQYQTGHNQWDALIRPYAPIFQQNPDVQPVAILQGLMNTHLQLLNPNLPSANKLELAKKILTDYGIDLGETPLAANAAHPKIAELEARLARAEAAQRQREEAAYSQGVSEQQKLVQAFAKDPKNEFFNEVVNDIFRFIQTGAAEDLPTAYELACYANPAVRAKILAKQQASVPNPTPNGQKPRFPHLDSDEPKPARTRKGSIDSTIDAVVAAHYPKH